MYKGRKRINGGILGAAAVCLLALAAFILQPVFGALKKKKTVEIPVAERIEQQFDADSAYQYCAAQCEFGPRTMNSVAHDKCGEWIKAKFAEFGCVVESQKADLKGFDGTILKSENIIARFNPDAKERYMICAHWDSRPWADNDPDEANHTKPVLAANDGASGVAVMLELARCLQGISLSPSGEKSEGQRGVGIDFICFDAEDWGTEGQEDSWALGAQYWSSTYAQQGFSLSPSGEMPTGQRGAILLDMVGGEGAKFYQEYYSQRYASGIVAQVWQAASVAGYGSFFPQQDGGAITDDHVPVNQVAGIPCIDIIPYYPDCEQSSFGPTWHTVDDTMDHISRSTLKAVGQTLLQLVLAQ